MQVTSRFTPARFTAAAGALALLLALAGCNKGHDREEDRRIEGPAERVGKELDEAAGKTAEHLDKARENFQEAAKETGRELDEAAGKAGEHLDKAGEQLDKAVEAVGEKLERAGEKVQASAEAARREDEENAKKK